MEWSDSAIVLSSRSHGESATIAVLLTKERGKHAGLSHNGQNSRHRAAFQPGSLVFARWRGRLVEQLGAYTLEQVRGFAAPLLDDPARLAALTAVCALTEACLAEREPHPALYDGLLALLDLLDGPVWGETLVRWEIGLLAELGFALDLASCAVTGGDGVNDLLTHVSPRTGRAVSASAAEPYLDKLLPLPGFLIGRGPGGPAEVAAGLRLTGYFLERFALHGPLPAARVRLAELCDRAAGGA